MIYGYIRVSSDRQTVENQRFEIERTLISQRTIESLARLKAEGRKIGRPAGSKNKSHALKGKEIQVYEWLRQGMSRSEIARRCHVSRNTLYRFLETNPPGSTWSRQ